MRLSIFIIILFIAGSLNAQTVTLSGKITGGNDQKLEVRVTPIYIGGQSTVTQIDVIGGSFSGELKLRRSGLIELVYAGQSTSLYLEFGDQLELSFSALDMLNSLEVKGKGSLNNQVLIGFNQQFGKLYADDVVKKEITAQSIDTYEMSAFDNRKKQLQYMEAKAGELELSNGFKTFMDQHIRYHYWYQLLAFPIIRGNNNKNNLKVAKLPDVMLEGISKLPLYNEKAMMSASYRNFLEYYTIYFSSKANGFNKYTDYISSAKDKVKFAAENLQGTPRTYVVAKHLYENCQSFDYSTLVEMNMKLQEFDKDGGYVAVVKKQCDPFLMAAKEKAAKNERLNKGTSTSAPKDQGFTMTDRDGKKVYLSDFKGKVVYIDFWASWCGPCRQQFPYSKELKKKFSAKDLKKVVFLYISIDANEGAWRKAIDQYSLEGVHALSPGNWGSQVCKALGISSIPRYMLLDKSGNIVQKSAKRPSDPAIYNDIINLMN